MTYVPLNLEAAVAKTKEQRRKEILRAEAAMKTLPQISIDTEHHFAEGLTARVAFLPKDTIVTGHIHLHDHIVVVVGDVTVATDDGSNRYTGTHTFVGKAGNKRAVHVHEDTTWVAINACTATTPEEAEAQNVVKTQEEYLLAQETKKCLT